MCLCVCVSPGYFHLHAGDEHAVLLKEGGVSGQDDLEGALLDEANLVLLTQLCETCTHHNNHSNNVLATITSVVPTYTCILLSWAKLLTFHYGLHTVPRLISSEELMIKL